MKSIIIWFPFSFFLHRPTTCKKIKIIYIFLLLILTYTLSLGEHLSSESSFEKTVSYELKLKKSNYKSMSGLELNFLVFNVLSLLFNCSTYLQMVFNIAAPPSLFQAPPTVSYVSMAFYLGTRMFYCFNTCKRFYMGVITLKIIVAIFATFLSTELYENVVPVISYNKFSE